MFLFLLLRHAERKRETDEPRKRTARVQRRHPSGRTVCSAPWSASRRRSAVPPPPPVPTPGYRQRGLLYLRLPATTISISIIIQPSPLLPSWNTTTTTERECHRSWTGGWPAREVGQLRWLPVGLPSRGRPRCVGRAAASFLPGAPPPPCRRPVAFSAWVYSFPWLCREMSSTSISNIESDHAHQQK